MSLLTTLAPRRRGTDEDDDPIDPRIEARRRAVHGERRHRRHRRVLVVAITITVLAALYGVTRTAALDVDRVQVEGAHQTTPDAVRQASGILVGDRLLDLDLARAEANIRALPWVRDVVAERSWKGTIDLRVTERSPVAALRVGTPPSPETWVLVDAERRVLAPLTTPPTELPVIAGVAPVAPGQQLDASSAEALTVAQALTPGLRSRVATVRVGEGGTVDLDVRPAGVVHLGSTDELGSKIQSMQTVFGQVDLHCLASVDLRVPDAPVLTRDRACV
jgi:cell division septal protein FtsQ